MIGDPALFELARLKLRGYLRMMKRRMSRPSGILFGLIGMAMILLWTGSILFQGRLLGSSDLSPELRTTAVRLGLLIFVFMTVLSSLSHRGLYLPKDEVERLFSAPVSRANLVRYRLLVNLTRSFFFALVMGVLAAMRLPNSGFAFCGTVAALLTIPILGQACSILFGDAENRLGRLAQRIPPNLVRVASALLAGGIFFALFSSQMPEFDLLGPQGEEPAERSSLLQHPALVLITRPAAPWANAIVAETWSQFLPWILFSLLTCVVAFELTARIPVDFRLMSLQTSADVARRLSKLRSGRSLVNSGDVSKRTVGWEVPWIFGKGPFGAIAWLKLVAIVRKSRGTLLFSLLVIGGATAFATFSESFADTVGGPVFIAVLGVLYLTSFLRFDFRADFDLMETFKAWPVAAWKIFLATLLPQVFLVTAMVSMGIIVHAIVHDGLGWEVALIVSGVPLITLMWMALDNAVFLFAPVRFEPGQGSAMHHTGRAMVMLFLRVILTLTLGGLLVITGAGVSFAASEWLHWDGPEIVALVIASVVAVAVGILWLLILMGAWRLQLFDVAREKTSS